MPGRWVPAALLLLLPLAGCSTPSPATPLPALDFPSMSVATVPLEAFEVRGILYVSWHDGLTAVHAEREDGMARYALHDGVQAYTSQTGLGWTRHDLQDLVDESGRGHRLRTWDLRGLLADARVVDHGEGAFVAVAALRVRGEPHDVRIEVRHDGPRIIQAVIRTDLDAEAPYTLVPQADPAPMPTARPTAVLDADAVAQGDGQAAQGHARVIGWVRAHRDQLGSLPQEPSAESLALQRLGAPWPRSPYDGRDLQDAHASGHFLWRRCGDQDADYVGLGWDGPVVTQSFGAGCPPA